MLRLNFQLRQFTKVSTKKCGFISNYIICKGRRRRKSFLLLTASLDLRGWCQQSLESSFNKLHSALSAISPTQRRSIIRSRTAHVSISQRISAASFGVGNKWELKEALALPIDRRRCLMVNMCWELSIVSPTGARVPSFIRDPIRSASRQLDSTRDAISINKFTPRTQSVNFLLQQPSSLFTMEWFFNHASYNLEWLFCTFVSKILFHRKVLKLIYDPDSNISGHFYEVCMK
jgi:hypothetical protein